MEGNIFGGESVFGDFFLEIFKNAQVYLKFLNSNIAKKSVKDLSL